MEPKEEELKMTPEERMYWECVILICSGELEGKRYGCPSLTDGMNQYEYLMKKYKLQRGKDIKLIM